MKKRLLAVGLLLLLGTLNVQSQQDPSTLPLVTAASLEYLGGFRTPVAPCGQDCDAHAYGGQGLAYDPATNTLFMNSNGRVTEISIQTPVNNADVNWLPVASLLQPPTDPTEGNMNKLYAGDAKTYSLMVVGNKLIGSGFIYFDASNEARVSHYSRSRNLSETSFSGWSQLWQANGQGYVGGFMTMLSPEWQTKLGGQALTGQCCIPIITRTSSGPAAFLFDPSKVGQPTVPATALLQYPANHATLGSWSNTETINPTFNMTTEILAVVQPAQTRSVLYFGKTGVGKGCYGEGTANPALVGTSPPTGGEPYCYDPTNSYKAPHAYPYRYQVWAYDLNDFVAVKAGTKEPWDVIPYGVWELSFPIVTTAGAGGVGYDPQRQLLYVAQMRADPGGCCSFRPVIQTFKLNAAAGGPPEPPVPPIPPDPPPVVEDPAVVELKARITELQGNVTKVSLERDAALAKVNADKAEAQMVLDRNATLKPSSKLPKWTTDAMNRIIK